MTQFIVERVKQIQTKKDFDTYIERVKMSNAPVDVREGIIEYAKKMHPKLYVMDESIKINAMKMIEESKGEFDDIEGYSA